MNISPLTNPNWEAFAQEVSKGQSLGASYAVAYQTEGEAAQTGGSRLMRHPAVLARVQSLQEEAGEQVVGSLRSARQRLFQIWANPETPPALVIRAIEAEAKLAGWERESAREEVQNIVVRIGGEDYPR
jgi:hypothetical protein